MKIGEQLKQARRHRGLTQKQVANFIGCSEAHVCHWEKNNRDINRKTLLKLESLLNIKFDEPKDCIILESKADKLYEIIKYIFSTPDNIDKIKEIWER